MTNRPSPPLRLDIVPADNVAALIERTDREFAELEQRAADTNRQALELEARAAAEGVDPAASMWAMVRLQRFLDGLREEAQRDIAASIAVAEHRARLRVQEAYEEVEARRLPGGSGPDERPPFPMRLPAAPTDHGREFGAPAPARGPVTVTATPVSPTVGDAPVARPPASAPAPEPEPSIRVGSNGAGVANHATYASSPAATVAAATDAVFHVAGGPAFVPGAPGDASADWAPSPAAPHYGEPDVPPFVAPGAAPLGPR